MAPVSKLLITAACEQKKTQGNGTNIFCPGYLDAITTPYEGKRRKKLEIMADAFCTHCKQTDNICTQLFCAPDRLLVDITMTMISTFCTELETLFPACHSEYCPVSTSKRAIPPSSERLDSTGGCYPTSDWSGVIGMDQWCVDNCKNGNDDITCPTTHCICNNDQSGPANTDNLGSNCLIWEASLVFSAVAGMDSWCQNSCSLGGDCPESHCRCKTLAPTTASATTPSISTPSISTPSISTPSISTSTTPSSTSSSSSAAPTTTTNSPSSEPSSTTPLVSSSTTSSSITATPSSSRSSTYSSTAITSTTVTSTTSSSLTPPSTVPSSTLTVPSSTSTSTSSSPSTTASPTSVLTSPSTSSVSFTTSTSHTSSSTAPVSSTTSESTTISSTSSSSPITSTLSVTFSSSFPSSSATTVVTTSVPFANFSDSDSNNVISGVVCDHAKTLDQNVLVDRYCPNTVSSEEAGYRQELVDQVLTFAPKLMCSFSDVSRESKQCPSMFCGESPLSQSLVKSSLCQVCQAFSDQLGSGCSVAYC